MFNVQKLIFILYNSINNSIFVDIVKNSSYLNIYVAIDI